MVRRVSMLVRGIAPQSEFLGADLEHSMVSSKQPSAPDCQHQEAACTAMLASANTTFCRTTGMLHRQYACFM
jgi:hypothetical protein